MELTAQYVKEYARSLGADLIGIGDVKRYDGCPACQDPRYILPTAKCVIGVGFRIPRGIMKTIKTQPYAYTALGVKALDEEMSTVFLLKFARLIENAGYEACIQRTCPNLLSPEKQGTNPEVKNSVHLQSISVDGVRPAPDVLIDFDKSAEICGMARLGLKGNALTPEFGPYQRFVFIVTNAPLETDEPLKEELCDHCGKCISACPGKAISEKGLDSWQCSVYYRGAAKENVWKERPADFEKIRSGEKRFDEKSAREAHALLDLLPPTHYGYVPCLCEMACHEACYQHLMEKKEAQQHD